MSPVRSARTVAGAGSVFLCGEDTSAALGRAAPAGVESLILFGVFVGSLVRVVVQQLFARLDSAPGVDEDAFAIVDRLAVAVARVVEVRRFVAVYRAVDTGLVVDGEEKGMVPPHVRVIVPLVGGAPGDALTEIFDDARALLDVARCERTLPLDLRLPDLEIRVRALLPR